MNIFVLDRDIRTCARYHADQHVAKMILEGTQMLCTVLNQNGAETPYKSTHTKHPCTLWAGRSLSNWTWLRKLTLQLNEEFLFRYRKSIDHESASVARELSPPPLPDIGLTEFAQAMPEAYKVPGNPVQAYRNFYVGEKWRFATWTRRRRPKWFTEAIRSKVQKPRAGDASRERLTRTVTRAALVTRTSVASISANEARGCESKREAHVTVR